MAVKRRAYCRATRDYDFRTQEAIQNIARDLLRAEVAPREPHRSIAQLAPAVNTSPLPRGMWTIMPDP